MKQLIRRAQYELVATVARLDGEGEFTERGVRPAPGVADLLRCREPEARRMVALGRALFPTALDGSPLQPRLPVTAAALAAAETKPTPKSSSMP